MIATIVLATIVGAAALVSIGCSKDESTKQQPTTLKKLSSPPKDVVYTCECIANSKCDELQRVAAAYDYVSFVYGNNTAFRYDSFLSTDESNYVANNFIPVLASDQISSLIRSARNKALAKHITTLRVPNCSDIKMWRILEANDPMLGAATAIGTVHHCFEHFSNIFDASGIELMVAAKPGDWIFLVEISKKVEADTDINKQDEVALLYQIADRLHIPVENPVIPFDSEPVITIMIENGYSRMDQAIAYAIATVNNLAMSNPQFRRKFDQLSLSQRSVVAYRLLHNYFVARTEQSSHIDDTIKRYGVHAGNFFAACKKALNVPKDENPGSVYDRLISKIRRIIQAATSASNRVSSKHVRDVLIKHGKSKALIQMGTGHLPIVNNVYEQVDSIPFIPKR